MNIRYIDDEIEQLEWLLKFSKDFINIKDDEQKHITIQCLKKAIRIMREYKKLVKK